MNRLLIVLALIVVFISAVLVYQGWVSVEAGSSERQSNVKVIYKP